MTDFLPLFPLKLVVYPGENLNLHIFEARYKQLIRECDQNKTSFGIPAYIGNKIMPIGTELQLLSIENRQENGEMDIKTRGIGVFKVEEFYSQAPNKLYPGADIKRLPLEDQYDLEVNEQILEKVLILFKLLKIAKKPPRSASTFRVYDIAHYIGLNIDQEYALLAVPTEYERQIFALAHLTKLIPMVESMEESKERAQMNGHFKHITPPDF